MKWGASKYSKQEIKDRRNECRYQRHRWFAWRPVIIHVNDEDGRRIGRHFVWLDWVERQFHYPSWSYHDHAGARSFRELVRD